MTHLGRWLSALVDGELDEAERDHVLNHLAGCQPCRNEANALRALKRRMTALGETSADSAVVRRLIDLGRPDPLVAAGPLFAASGSSAALDGSALARRAHPARHGRAVAAGLAGAIIVTVGLASFLLGAPPGSPRPQITPTVYLDWIEHVHDMGQAPTKPGAPAPSAPVGVRPAGTAAPKPSTPSPSMSSSSASRSTVTKMPVARKPGVRPSARMPASRPPAAWARIGASRVTGRPVLRAFAP